MTEYHNGQRIKVTGTVGDAESGNLRGETGAVCGVNAQFVNRDGVPMTNVRLDSGAVVAVPTKALRKHK